MVGLVLEVGEGREQDGREHARVISMRNLGLVIDLSPGIQRTETQVVNIRQQYMTLVADLNAELNIFPVVEL